ncbi:MAG: GPW/gp25 family protein [Candidatus Competibacteraceae bacterium]
MVENETWRPSSFLGSGWSFPPEFVRETGQVVMTADEEDIKASLKILFGTALGERFLNPKYGLDLQAALFDPVSTTLKAFLKDHIKTAILIYEPRINLLALELDTSAQYEGRISIIVEYEIRATNSRYNLVYPFYTVDSNELRRTVGNL